MRSTELRSASRRIGAMRALGLVGFLVLAARAAYLTVIDEQGGDLWRRQVYARIELPAARGTIFDRRGTELAVTTNAPSVYAIGRDVEPGAHRAIARALGFPAARVRDRLADRRGFVYIARWVSAESARRIEALELPGVGIVQEPRRRYPTDALAGRVLGFADIDGNGVRGIEQQENRWLSGTRLVVPVERDGGGRLLSRSPLRASDAAGGDVMLTLDASLQAEAETALRESVESTGARGGSIITMDPTSGDILALAEWPPFDPNRFRSTRYRDTGSPAFVEAVEPGSTLKAFLVAGVLDSEAIPDNELLATAGGEVAVPGKIIRDRRDFGPLDLAGMLRVSSNVGAVLAAQRLGREEHFDTLRRFGFGRPTRSGFPSESAGLLRPWRRWQPVDHATIAFGQGISSTPIQLAAATAALASDGVWRTPRLVLARRSPEGEWQPTPASQTHAAVSKATARRVVEMMRAVVGPEGTGRLAGLSGVDVAGKTGTAQKLDPETRRYGRDRYIAWFIGIVPAESPKLVITVMLDEPGKIHSGGGVAAPLFARVASSQLAHLGIATRPEPIRASPAPTGVTQVARHIATPTEAPSPVPRKSAVLPAKEPETPPLRSSPKAKLSIVAVGTRLLMPDFRGHSLADVRQVTAAHSLDLETSGSGQAIFQQPAPGTILGAGQRRVRVRFADAPPAKWGDS